MPHAQGHVDDTSKKEKKNGQNTKQNKVLNIILIQNQESGIFYMFLHANHVVTIQSTFLMGSPSINNLS